MRPTLPCLFVLAHVHLTAADVQWDGGAGTTLWGDALNWSSNSLPVAGDTVWFTNGPDTAAALTLNQSFTDSGVPLNLVLGAGHDFRIDASAGCELYLGDVTVLDAQTYTLRVPRTLAQPASGTMPAAGSTWDIAAGGTLIVLEDLGSKVLASGVWTKTGAGTLRLGNGSFGTLATPLTQLRVTEGLVELNYILGHATNGIVGISEGATVRTLCYSPNTTFMLTGSAVYTAGVTGVAGSFDLNGFDQRWRALSGTATGRVFGNSGIDPVTLTLGVGDLSPSITRESDGDFAGSIEDGATGRLRLLVHGGRAGYTQTLSGQNTFTGGTVVRGGRLVLGHATDTLSDIGSVDVERGTIDLGGNSDTIGALTLRTGSVFGTGGVLRTSTLTIDNSEASVIGPQIVVDGPAAKSGTGTLTLQGGGVFAQGFSVTGSDILADGQTLTGDIILQESGLTISEHFGSIHCGGATRLSGRVASGGTLSSFGADISTTGLVIAGSLQVIETRFLGGAVTVEGIHQLVSWFGVNTFGAGLTYGAESVVEWVVGSDIAWGYIDGTTAAERGCYFGAIDVGDAGLVITPGARLHILAPDPTSDTFWQSMRTFKVISWIEGASITGTFQLTAADGSVAMGWSAVVAPDGLYLDWAGAPTPAPVPEASALPFIGALTALAVGIRKRTQAAASRHAK